MLKILGLMDIVSCTELVSSKQGLAVMREEMTEELHRAGTALAWWMTPVGQGVWTVADHAAWRPRVENVMFASANMTFQLTIYRDTPRAGQKTALPSIQDVALDVQTAAEVWRDVELYAFSWSIDLLVAFDPAAWGTLQPELWLAEFLAHCHRCQVDALALRDSSCDVDSLRDHVDLYRPLGKPLWLMDMSCSEFNISYVKEASEILKEERLVQKFAWRNSMWRSEGSESRGEDFVSAAGAVSGAGQVLSSVPSPCEPREVGAPTRLLQNSVADILSDMKAVHYVPRMVGLTLTDPMNAFFSRMYHRDLQTIREELGGDTIVLAEPSENLPLGGSWERFLDECVSQGVAVLASFSMKFFIDLGLSSSEMSSAIEKSFDNFLRYFMMGDSERNWGDAYCTAKGFLHPAVKGWIITGLPTLEALVTGAYFTLGGVTSESDESLLTRTTVRVGIRSVSQCVRMMYGEEALLGLAVSLDTPTAKANTTLFDTSLSSVIDSFELDDFEGEYFDFWVLEAKLPPVPSAVAQVLAALETLNGNTQRKPIIPQLGVSSAIPQEGVVDVQDELQQELLVQIFDTVVTLFLRSLIIFEFSDDWSATEGLNDTSCAAGYGGVLMQSTCGSISGLVHDTTVVAVEYMGLSAHTTWLLHACIEPRWLDVDSGPHGVGVLSQEVVRREGAFSFEGGTGEGNLRMCVMSSYMDVVLPTIVGDASVPHSMVLLALLFILATCCAWFFNKPTSDKACPAAESAPPGTKPFDNGIGGEKYTFQHNLSRREATSPSTPIRFFGRACSTMSLSDVESSFTFSVAAFSTDPLRELKGQEVLTVYLSQLCDERHAHVVLRSALASQQRILEYHVLSEERCQPPSRDNVFHKAVRAVHRRALEGYFLWARTNSGRVRTSQPCSSKLC